MYIEEKLDMILSKLEAIERKLDRLELKGVMSVSDIAAYTGVSKQLLYTTKRYLLPDYGEGKAEGRMEWTKAEVMEWLDRGEESLRKGFTKRPRTK